MDETYNIFSDKIRAMENSKGGKKGLIVLGNTRSGKSTLSISWARGKL
jgi:hypothetical protein